MKGHVMLAVTVAVVAIGLLGLMGSEARAVDLSGIWNGTVICSGINGEDGTKEKEISQDANVRIVQQGSALNVYFFNLGSRYNGQLVQESTNPSKGTATFVSCQTDNTIPIGSEIVQLDFTSRLTKACDPSSPSNGEVPCNSETVCGGTPGVTTLCALRRIPKNLNGTSVRLGDHADQFTCTWSLKFDHSNIHLTPSC